MNEKKNYHFNILHTKYRFINLTQKFNIDTKNKKQTKNTVVVLYAC